MGGVTGGAAAGGRGDGMAAGGGMGRGGGGGGGGGTNGTLMPPERGFEGLDGTGIGAGAGLPADRVGRFGGGVKPPEAWALLPGLNFANGSFRGSSAMSMPSL